jgi:pimeloyl-ACP methyl ester carboxylesterase
MSYSALSLRRHVGGSIPALTAMSFPPGERLTVYNHRGGDHELPGPERAADDIASLIKRLGMDQADVLGYSLGGGAALRLAIQHPALVRRLVLLSTPCKRTGWYPEVLAGFDVMGSQFAEMFRPSPVYEVYSRVAPRVEDFPVLLDRAGDLLRQDYDWAGEIAGISAPVMLVFGDADSVKPEHIVEFYQLLGGGQRDAHWDGSLRPPSRLAVLPGQIHTDVLTAPGLAASVSAFITAPALVPPSMEPAQP